MAYESLELALKLSEEELLKKIEASKLRGRGGAGFLVSKKIAIVKNQTSDEKYIICNGIESDPWVFKDRSILETRPDDIVEGMIILSKIIGAKTGYICIKAKDNLAIEKVEKAIADAKLKAYLGADILNLGWDFELEIIESPSNFITGEESSLISFIEGKRPEPIGKKEYPAIRGVFEKPTLVNNVETIVNIPNIILKSKSKFETETKFISLRGNVMNEGVFEIPLGMTIEEIINTIGNGRKRGTIKFVSIGGITGSLIPENMFDLKFDYETLKENDISMGSGEILVLDEESCIVELVKMRMKFMDEESCGKCTPCREGFKRISEILEKITSVDSNSEDLDKLKEISDVIRELSLCGFGKYGITPLISSLKYFYEEYESHIFDKKCYSGACKNLVRYEITQKCLGCGKCFKYCHLGAILKRGGNKYSIEVERCDKCGICYQECPFEAIKKI